MKDERMKEGGEGAKGEGAEGKEGTADFHAAVE